MQYLTLRTIELNKSVGIYTTGTLRPAFVDIGLSLLTTLNILHNIVLILSLLTLNKLMPASSTTMMNCLGLVYPYEITFFQLGPLPAGTTFLTLHKTGVSTVFHVQTRAMITLTASKKKWRCTNFPCHPYRSCIPNLSLHLQL